MASILTDLDDTPTLGIWIAMKGIRRALVLSTSERYFILVVNFATLAVVSRVLAPAEIGVSVIGFAILAMSVSLREFATTNFIVQRKQLKPEDVRATFTFLMLLSGALSFLIFLSASELAALYKEPNLAPFLVILSLCILIEIIGAPIAALLRREMAFGKLAVINMTGAAVNAGLTITLALLGFSYMSFAWAALASQTAIAGLSLFIWPDRSIFKPCLIEWRDMVTFGGYNGANVLLYRIYETLPYIVFGRLLSVNAVALYNRGIIMCQLPEKMILGGVGSVLLSAFSAEVREGRGLRTAYLRSVELITALQWPALIMLAILADPVVRIVLGDQWLGSVPLVRIMAIASLFTFSAELNFAVLLAVGAMRDLLMRSLIAWPISAVVITCAAFFGLKAAALSWLAVLPYQAYVSIYFAQRHVDFNWRDNAIALRKSAVVALFTAAGPLAVVTLTGGLSDISNDVLIVAVILAAIGWGAGLLTTAHPLLPELQRVAEVFFRSTIVRKSKAGVLPEGRDTN